MPQKQKDASEDAQYCEPSWPRAGFWSLVLVRAFYGGAQPRSLQLLSQQPWFVKKAIRKEERGHAEKPGRSKKHGPHIEPGDHLAKIGHKKPERAFIVAEAHLAGSHRILGLSKHHSA